MRAFVWRCSPGRLAGFPGQDLCTTKFFNRVCVVLQRDAASVVCVDATCQVLFFHTFFFFFLFLGTLLPYFSSPIETIKLGKGSAL